MSLVVGVQAAGMGKMYYCDPGGLELAPGDRVVVKTPQGEQPGEVVMAPREVADSNILSPLKEIVRRVEETECACRRPARNTQKEQNAFRIGEEKIRKHKLEMKLIDVEYAPDGSKLIFYFSAEGRIDFRELVKDLAAVFKTRIELRQIGVRDEAKKIGGLGPCGRPCCCNAFMDDFVPVSIKMAKEQNLSLSPTKISGLCGRLMCCLHYEQDHYHEMRKQVPRIGSYMVSPAGAGEVCSTDVLTGRTKIRIALTDGTFEMHTFALAELSPYEGDRPPVPAPRPAPEKPAHDKAAGAKRREPRKGTAPKRRDGQHQAARSEGRKEEAGGEDQTEHRRRQHRPRKSPGGPRKKSAAPRRTQGE